MASVKEENSDINMNSTKLYGVLDEISIVPEPDEADIEVATINFSVMETPRPSCFLSPNLPSACSSSIERNQVGESASSLSSSPPAPEYSPVLGLENVEVVMLDDSTIENIGTEEAKRPKIKRSVLKAAVNSGQQYVNMSGREIPAKKVKSPCSEVFCAHKCCKNINLERRNDIFIGFYTLDQDSKRQFIAHHVDVVPKKTGKPTDGSPRRKVTHNYFLTVKERSRPIERLRVCQKFFLNTLSISFQAVKTTLQKTRPGAVVSPDKRGKTVRPPSPETAEQRANMREHIESFPVVPSHYCRKSSKKLYFEKTLSVPKMHSLFVEQGGSATLRQYRTFFKKEFKNYSFFSPRKDCCNICFAYDRAPLGTVDEKQQKSYDKHIDNKTKGRDQKEADKKLAISDKTIITACFDFQKVLTTPHAEAGLLYYKRKLSVYNFTVYDMAARQGDCYCWDEATGKKGSTEVASCLYAYMLDQIEAGAKEFVFYSDNCAGQNKNRFVFGMYAFVARLKNVSIRHHFLEQGHTQMEVDSVHAVIESAKGKKDIFEPKQWYALMRGAKKAGKLYKVHELDSTDFYDFKTFVNSTNWTRNSTGQVVNWSKVKGVKIEKDNPHIVKYQLEHKTDFKSIVLYEATDVVQQPSQRRKRKSLHYTFDPVLQLAYNGPMLISNEKYKDLMALCKSSVIPKIYHNFYISLPHVGQESGALPKDEDDNFLDEFFVDEF